MHHPLLTRYGFSCLLLYFFFLGWIPSSFAATDCTKLNDAANAKTAMRYPRESYSVTGSGRLYFHSAPSAECKDKNTFVIPGDSLVLYSDFKDWYSVGYFNAKTGNDVFGWVNPARLKYRGTLGPKD